MDVDTLEALSLEEVQQFVNDVCDDLAHLLQKKTMLINTQRPTSIVLGGRSQESPHGLAWHEVS